MSSGPPTKWQKTDIRNGFHRVLNEARGLLKPHSDPTTQQSLAAGVNSAGATIHPELGPPGGSTSSTPGVIGTSAHVAHAQTNTNSGAAKKTPSPSWTGLETALKNLHLTVKVFPPLQSATGTLISCLEQVQVNGNLITPRHMPNSFGY